MFKSYVSYACCAILLLLGGCGKSPRSEYKPQKLYDLNFFTADDYKKENGVTMFAKRFDRDDCTFYFNKKQLSNLVPIQLTIMNENAHDIAFNPEEINMPLANHKTIKKSLRPSHGRSLGVFFIAPIALIGGAFALLAFYGVALGSLLLPTALLLSGPSLYLGTKSAIGHSHKLRHICAQSDESLEKKMILQPITIKSETTFSCLLFVKKQDLMPRMLVDVYRVDGNDQISMALKLAR